MLGHYWRTVRTEEEFEQAIMDIYNFNPEKDARFKFLWKQILFSTEIATDPRFKYEDAKAQEFLDEIHNKRLYELIRKYNVDVNQKITDENITEAMKYLCENIDKPYSEVLDGLLQRGFYWTVDNVVNQFGPQKINVLEGLYNGDHIVGACVVGNVFDGYYSYQIIKDQYLSYDTYASGYQYVRTVTGDESYTKANIRGETEPPIKLA